MNLKVTSISSVFAVFTAFASANITYIDAVEGAGGNTFATGGTLEDTSWTIVSNQITANQTQWDKRLFGNGGTIFQAWHTLPSTMPELTTKITGLNDGTYDVWVFFWDQPSPQRWNISAGLTSGNLTTYGTTSPEGPGNTTAAVRADSLTFTDTSPAVITTEATRVMYGVNLGQATVTDGSDINVFINNLEGGGNTLRTWFDGVGYAPATVSTEQSLAITSFTAIGGDVWEVVLTGEPTTSYQFRSAAMLDFESGTLVEGLTQGDPGDAGSIAGSTLTTDAQGTAVARMTLTGSANFVRAETLPPVPSADLETDR